MTYVCYEPEIVTADSSCVPFCLLSVYASLPGVRMSVSVWFREKEKCPSEREISRRSCFEVKLELEFEFHTCHSTGPLTLAKLLDVQFHRCTWEYRSYLKGNCFD